MRFTQIGIAATTVAHAAWLFTASIDKRHNASLPLTLHRRALRKRFIGAEMVGGFVHQARLPGNVNCCKKIADKIGEVPRQLCPSPNSMNQEPAGRRIARH